jgi:two-component system CheB/CheR fusion protein
MADKKRKKRSPAPELAAGSTRPAIDPATDKTGTSPIAIVGVGASAGGLESLQDLFRNMPGSTGMAFVVVTHLHPGHSSLLQELLARVTAVPVMAAVNGVKVQADHIYVGQPGAQLSIHGGVFQRLEEDKNQAPRMPINYFLRSLALDQKARAICIILSGTGTDGTLGLGEIKGALGMVMVEQPQTAQYAGMPSSAIATGLADFVLPPAEMPQKLVDYVSSPDPGAMLSQMAEATIPIEPMRSIFLLLRTHTGHDFSEYKQNTIYRRIARRMNLHQISDHQQYVRYLRENPDEIDALFKELLISVTNFFRDPEAWEALVPELGRLIESRPEGSVLRAWVPGCSSGEEVFSIAILLRECLEASQRNLDVQIFGTDLDAQAIDRARTGRYSEGIVDDVSPQRLQKYFVKEDGHYRIRKEVREMTIFAEQNAIKDPPFTKMDIVSCRNTLIYLNAEVQKKLLPIFHYALKPEGLLLLGSSESVGSFSDLFETVDKRWKIFRRREMATERAALPEFPMRSLAADTGMLNLATQRDLIKSTSTPRLIERLLLNRFVPPSAIVNSRGDIIYVHGRTGAYLEPNEGQPRNNILEMAREGLQLDLAEAIRHCVANGGEIVRKGIRVSGNGDGRSTTIDLEVISLQHPEALRELLLVAFSPAASPLVGTENTVGEPARDAEAEERVDQLERALRFLRETHQATLEDLETSNEELEATNEELQSTNEELQSTNEELETSKEEMQSLNEELTTVNSELLSKVSDLSQANDDMQNLLNSTRIATVFLDENLRIKRFTEQAKELVMLRQTDLGRPISELASNLQQEDLAADCRNVMRTLVFKEAEVKTRDDTHFLMRIMPYRTADNAIDGLVLTFVDISRLKQMQRELRHMSEVFREGADPVIIVDLEDRVIDLNDCAIKAYGYTRDEIQGKSTDAIMPPARREAIAALLQRSRDGESVRNVPWVLLSRSGDEVPIRLTLSLLTDEQGEVDAIAMRIRQPEQ